MEATAAHDAFLAKIGSKIGVVAKDGTLSRQNITPMSDSTPFLKPFRQRSLPLVARRFLPRPTDKKKKAARQPYEKYSSAVDLNKEVPATSSDTVVVQSVSPGKLSVSLLQEPEIDICSIAGYEKSHIDEVENIPKEISMPEKQYRRYKSIQIAAPKEKSLIESAVLQKISEWSVFDVQLLRDITRIIEPIVAADILYDYLNDMSAGIAKERDYTEEKPIAPSSKIMGNIAESNYDISSTLVSAGFLFMSHEVRESLESKYYENKGEDKGRFVSRSKLFESQKTTADTQQHYPYMRNLPPSIPADPYNASYSKTKKFTNTTVSAPLLSRESTPKPKVYNKDRNESPTCIVRLDNSLLDSKFGDTEHSYDINDGFDSEFMWGRDPPGENEGQYVETMEDYHQEDDSSKSANLEDEEQSNVIDNESDAPRTSSCSSRRRERFKPNFFPKEVSLGSLGPDKENEEYISKLGKVAKQKEYSDKIRKMVLAKCKPTANSPKGRETKKAPDEKATKLPTLITKPTDGNGKFPTSLTKAQKMKFYASNIKKPDLVLKKSAKSLTDVQFGTKLPPISKRRCSSVPSYSPDLVWLETKHNSDVTTAENIRKSFKNM
ncbi:hypothetical protein HK103_006571 [Boothiomyces macroporosus]|uniref:Uncharacterized protein n=1 Tax=Boothiomyces macroporosus TaxID=261099 RepID=A0AAD5Y4L8_9FUNG|nr:hypothetical protein HK103_006571 [Boothiomyces macroporosus]